GDEVLRLPGGVTAAALSPDGRRALLAESKGALLVADLEPKDLGRVKADREAFEALWSELGGEGSTAYRAAGAVAKWGGDAVRLIRSRLGPAPEDDPTLRRLISGLGAERHVVRLTCSAALAGRGAEASAALKAAQKWAKSPLLRRQLEYVLDLPGVARLPEEARLDRADWVLERIGTKEADEARRQLAGGREGSGAPQAEPRRPAREQVALPRWRFGLRRCADSGSAPR